VDMQIGTNTQSAPGDAQQGLAMPVTYDVSSEPFVNSFAGRAIVRFYLRTCLCSNFHNELSQLRRRETSSYEFLHSHPQIVTTIE
jgi:hypothetical protein